MPEAAFHLSVPESRLSSVVFASPHSGNNYQKAFVRQSLLDERSIRSSEDAFVDLLFEMAPDFGSPFLKAAVPRAYVDLNRSPDELDPALIEGVRRYGHNPRVASGLGVIPRVVANGRAIYRGKLSMSEAQFRIEKYWRPYHHTLQGLLDEAHQQFGNAILVDCHSMPHEAMDGMTHGANARPDVVLGDRFGAAASNEVVERLEAAFAAAGLKVARNAPFAGAYITQAYGRPSRCQHAVQVEIDRALYMDEKTVTPRADFHEFRDLLRNVVSEIAEIGYDRIALAAE
jgi:N-formylglutamate deformylase